MAGVLLSAGYALQALLVWLLPRWRRDGQPRTHLTRGQWLLTLGVDLVVFAAMHAFEPAGTFNYAALLVLPALIAACLTRRPIALATTAVASLMLLAVAVRSGVATQDFSAALAPAGLTGIGCSSSRCSPASCRGDSRPKSRRRATASSWRASRCN
jgi:hypothetical protein